MGPILGFLFEFKDFDNRESVNVKLVDQLVGNSSTLTVANWNTTKGFFFKSQLFDEDSSESFFVDNVPLYSSSHSCINHGLLSFEN
jgi:hypothetical protein